MHPICVSSIKRAPLQPLVDLRQTLSEVTGPIIPREPVDPKACDLARQHAEPPWGERIIVSGGVLDENSRPVPHTLVEIWQANAAGRYVHRNDQHGAPLDPNFTGNGHALTDSQGHYRFVTIRPGEYPWSNHHNAWRPAYIHFSLFGPAFASRLVTQMYFPGNPLIPFDPVFSCTADEKARNRLISLFDWETTSRFTRLAIASTSFPAAAKLPRWKTIPTEMENESAIYNLANRRPFLQYWPYPAL